MLLLSRKTGQSIVLDDNIEITVTRIANNRVRIGIAAPQDVHIRRGELIEWERGEASLQPGRNRTHS